MGEVTNQDERQPPHTDARIARDVRGGCSSLSRCSAAGRMAARPPMGRNTLERMEHRRRRTLPLRSIPASPVCEPPGLLRRTGLATRQASKPPHGEAAERPKLSHGRGYEPNRDRRQNTCAGSDALRRPRGERPLCSSALLCCAGPVAREVRSVRRGIPTPTSNG